MNTSTRRVLLALTLIASIFAFTPPVSAGGLTSGSSEKAPVEESATIEIPAAPVTEESNLTIDPPTLTGPANCSGDLVFVFNTRFLQGSSAPSETIPVVLPAGVYDLTFNTYDGYGDRANTHPSTQTSERVEVLGFVSADLEDEVTEAWGVGTGRIVIPEALDSLTATHVPAVGPDSVMISTVCFDRVEEPKPATPVVTFECVGPDVVEFTVTSDEGEVTVMVNGVAVEGTTGTVAPGDEVTAVTTIDGQYGPVVSETAVASAPDCADENEPVSADVVFECVGPDSLSYVVTSDAAKVEVIINGQAAELTGTVASGTVITVTTYTTAVYGDPIVLVTEFTAGDCEPEIEIAPATIEFECTSENTLTFTVTAAEGQAVTVMINGVVFFGLTGEVAPGDVVSVTVTAEGLYSEVTASAEAVAPDCAPEVEASVSIDTVCNDDFDRSYRVTAADGTTITSVKVNGVDAPNSGPLFPGDVVTATGDRDGVYVDTVSTSEALTGTDCTLPVTGVTMNLLAAIGFIALAAGVALMVARRRMSNLPS